MFDQIIKNKTIDPDEMMDKYTELLAQFNKEKREHEESKKKLSEKDLALWKVNDTARIASVDSRQLLYDRQMISRNIAHDDDNSRMIVEEFEQTIKELKQELLNKYGITRAPLLKLGKQKDEQIRELKKELKEMQEYDPTHHNSQTIDKLKKEQIETKEEIRILKQKLITFLDRELEQFDRFEKIIAEKNEWIRRLLHAQNQNSQVSAKFNYGKNGQMNVYDPNQQIIQFEQETLQKKENYNKDLQIENDKQHHERSN